MIRKSIISAAYFAFTAFAAAQEVRERPEQQPPPITQEKVEKDAKLAQQERMKHEAEMQAREKARKTEEKITSNTINTTRKTSTRPKEQ